MVHNKFCWENESGSTGHHPQLRIPSRKASPHLLTSAHLAPKWPLSQRGTAWRGQFGDGAPGGNAVGLEQMGCIFGKLQDVTGVCWLGVNRQDGACGRRGTGRRVRERSRRVNQSGSHLNPLPATLPPQSGPLPLPHYPHPGSKAASLGQGLGAPFRLGAPQR